MYHLSILSLPQEPTFARCMAMSMHAVSVVKEKGRCEGGTLTGYRPWETAYGLRRLHVRGQQLEKELGGEEWREHSRSSLCKGPEEGGDLVPLKRIEGWEQITWCPAGHAKTLDFIFRA